jgi:hypothetical protein
METRGYVLPVWRGLLLSAALWGALASYPALAQDGAPAAGGDAPQTGDGAATKGAAPDGTAATSRDIEPFTPQRGSAGLWRRANLKALIANPPNKAAGLPPANVRISPSPMRPGMEMAPQRNAIGAATPSLQLPGHGIAGVATPAGNRPSGIGTPLASITGVTRQTPVPNAGQTLRGAAINGTTMGHVASGPGSVGGPVKDRSGINGTLMPPKH